MELKDYLAIIRKRILVILGVPVVILAATLGFSYMQKPVYKASTTLMVTQTQPRYGVLAQFIDQYPGIQIPREVVLTINTIKEIIPSRPVLERASKMVNHEKTVLQFKKSVSSQVLADTQLIEISANAGDRQMAKKMANAVAESLMAFLRETEGKDVTYKIKQVEPAVLNPSSPASPRPLRNGIIGGFLGLILGFGAAVLLEHLDASVKSKDELSTLLEKPVLGEIPQVTSGKPGDLKQEPGEQARILEETRTLRTNIQCLDLERSLKSILLTSPDRNAGTTFLSLQLARAYAATGKKVALVDVDLRNEFHPLEETASERGVTNVILGTIELADALVDTDMELLKYLPSGPLPPNPSEMLDSSGMQRILAGLDKDFDLIILDSSPIVMFSDPLVLASRVDGVILVAASGSTSGVSLKAAGELLTGPNINLMGTVLNRIKASRRQYYDYDYNRLGKKKRMGKGRR